MKRSLLLFFAFLASTVWPASLSPNCEREISHLLAYLESSGCEFYRSGVWYDSRTARQHLERKYKYLVGKNLVDSAETFVALAGTKSSMSGEPYQVRCGNDAAISSADWLRSELDRFRAANR